MAHQADEHLGLARAGHAVEQVFPPSCLEIGQHHVHGLLLIGGQGRIIHLGFIPGRTAQHLRLFQADQAVFRQGMQRFHRVADKEPQFLHRMLIAVPQQIQEHFALLRSPLPGHRLIHSLRRDGQLHHGLGFDPHPSPAHLGREHQAQGFRQGAMGAFCHAVRQRQKRRQDGGVILQGAADLPQLFRGNIAVLREAYNNPLFDHAGKGDLYPLPHLESHARGNPIGEGAGDVFMHDVHDDLCVHARPPFPRQLRPFQIIAMRTKGQRPPMMIISLFRTFKQGGSTDVLLFFVRILRHRRQPALSGCGMRAIIKENSRFSVKSIPQCVCMGVRGTGIHAAPEKRESEVDAWLTSSALTALTTPCAV